MMKRTVLLALWAVMACTGVYAQHLYIYGSVTHEDSPVVGANVVEMDVNYRILNQTKTDKNGRFQLSVSGGKTSLRVTSEGLRRFTHKIGTRTNWEIVLKSESKAEREKKVKQRIETSKLLVGHIQGRTVPQLTWVEQLNDTVYCLVIPVRVSNGVEEYPAGRRLAVLTTDGRTMTLGICTENALAEEGQPASWDPFLRYSSNHDSSGGSGFTSNDSDYFCYPRFRFSLSDLENMLDNHGKIACFAVDTSRGDNFWILYTHRDFAKELQKILNKMLK